MNLAHLRTFVAIAEAGNITHAARRLGTTQPAASKQLADLEGELGVTLFDRLARGVRLNEEGRVLLDHAERLFAAERAAEAELAELSGLKRGRLSVGASTTIGSYVIPSVFGMFHRNHPDVKLELEIANTAMIQHMVVDGRIDLGLTEGFARSEALDVEVVHYDEMVCIAAPGHPALARAPLPPTALADYPVLMRERGSGTRDVIEAALGDLGVRLEPEMALGSTEALKNAVASGLGLALVSRLSAELELATGRLAELTLRGCEIRRALHLVTLRGKRLGPAVRAFTQLLRDSWPEP